MALVDLLPFVLLARTRCRRVFLRRVVAVFMKPWCSSYCSSISFSFNSCTPRCGDTADNSDGTDELFAVMLPPVLSIGGARLVNDGDVDGWVKEGVEIDADADVDAVTVAGVEVEV